MANDIRNTNLSVSIEDVLKVESDCVKGTRTGCVMPDSDDMLQCESCSKWTHYACTK